MNLSKSIAFITFAVLLSACGTDSDSLTVADIHEQRTQLSGQQVTISGEVVKVNEGIMRRNFIHIQDGTRSGDNDKVIVTSQQTAKIGDKVTVTGTMKLDTDFTMGYVYPTLIEKSTITPAK